MSRSYKKTPVIKDHNSGMKATANRKLRRKLNQKCDFPIADGNAYRRVVDSWEISDWRFRETWREYQARAERYKIELENDVWRWGLRHVRDDSEGMHYWKWFRMYKRK